MPDTNTTIVPFTQYLLPDGRRRQTEIALPGDSLQKDVDAILSAGLYFECEVLTTGDVSFTITDRDEEEDLAIEVCLSGPQVTEAVSGLILRFVGGAAGRAVLEGS